MDLLGDGSPLSALVASDDTHGVSDMINYGVSLGRAARTLPGNPNLFIIPGGAESPLTDDILGDAWWGRLFDQVKRSGGLVLVAAPSIVPSIDRLVSRTDGVLLVGESVAGERDPRVPVLAEIRAPAALRLPQPVATSTPTAPFKSVESGRWIWGALLVLVLGGAAVVATRWQQVSAMFGGKSASKNELAPIPPEASQQAAAPARPTPKDAGYAVQFLYLNSAQEANTILAQNKDSLPAATITMLRPATDSVPWYGFIVGAFPDSASAQSFLSLARTRGLLPPSAGRVVHTPFALLVDSAQSESMAAVRRSAYQGRGIPAYTLRDSSGMWRIYAGAFASESDGASLKRQLDSLNIQSVMVTRTGSGS